MEQITFINQSVFELSRAFLGEPHAPDEELNDLIEHTYLSDSDNTGMFLEGFTYLMSVDTNALTSLN